VPIIHGSALRIWTFGITEQLRTSAFVLLPPTANALLSLSPSLPFP